MKKYRETKAKKIFAGLENRIQRHIEVCIDLYAEANAKDDEVKATEWRGNIAGLLDCLYMMDVITIKEEMLLNEYAISQAWDKAEEIKNGAV
jgi:hypothetical protein